MHRSFNERKGEEGGEREKVAGEREREKQQVGSLGDDGNKKARTSLSPILHAARLTDFRE